MWKVFVFHQQDQPQNNLYLFKFVPSYLGVKIGFLIICTLYILGQHFLMNLKMLISRVNLGHHKYNIRHFGQPNIKNLIKKIVIFCDGYFSKMFKAFLELT